MVRTILVFPEFSNRAVIDELRNQYDPLVHLIRPHITLVFPFESTISNETLAGILRRTLADVHPFPIRVQGVRKQSNIFGNTLMLDVTLGKEILQRIHDAFYRHEFQEFDAGIPYAPHITVGNFKTTEELEDAYQSVRTLSEFFETTIDRVSVEMIGTNDESIIIIEHELE